MWYDPIHERDLVHRDWAVLVDAAAEGCARQSQPPHPYFIDHYGYLFALHRTHKMSNPIYSYFYPQHLRAFDDAWQRETEMFIKSCSAWRDDLPNFDSILILSDRAQEIIESWAKWLIRNGLCIPDNHFQLAADCTWSDLFAQSVHYPNRPAIPGPTFFQRLPTSQREEVSSKYGKCAARDLYVVLLRIHERSHFLQSGCPLMNELTLSALWGHFLTEEGHWIWQEDRDQQKCFNLEWPFTGRLNLSTKDWAILFHDSYLGLRKLDKLRAHLLYLNIRELAWKFNNREIGYISYVGNATRLISSVAFGA